MEKIITYENLRRFAYSNDKICTRPIRALAIEFFGLGGQVMFGEHPETGQYYAQRGILFLVPYNNPWAWMNPQAVAYTDELVDVLFEWYGLGEDIPIIATGGSMGGLSALIYTAYAKRTPKACVANCPVCDLPYHYTEREDLPRTLYSAFSGYEGSMEEALRAHSPLHLAKDGKMPRVDYTIFHCTADMAVNKEMHSDRLIEAMEGHRLCYYAVPDRGHCDLGEEMTKRYMDAIVAAAIE